MGVPFFVGTLRWTGIAGAPQARHSTVRSRRATSCSAPPLNCGVRRREIFAVISFEWDPDKAASNLAKHGVSFAEAATAFADPLSLTIFDPDHSKNEDRYLLVGLSTFGNLVMVSHTDRSGTIRIINARRADRRERLQYEAKH
jgi:uncharacterized DUF497 family protein